MLVSIATILSPKANMEHIRLLEKARQGFGVQGLGSALKPEVKEDFLQSPNALRPPPFPFRCPSPKP